MSKLPCAAPSFPVLPHLPCCRWALLQMMVMLLTQKP
jgi:hypothetical protein